MALSKKLNMILGFVSLGLVCVVAVMATGGDDSSAPQVPARTTHQMTVDFEEMAGYDAIPNWGGEATNMSEAQMAEQLLQGALLQTWMNQAAGTMGGSPGDAYSGGNFYGNSNLGTAVSSSGGSGYIALGNGDFVSW